LSSVGTRLTTNYPQWSSSPIIGIDTGLSNIYANVFVVKNPLPINECSGGSQKGSSFSVNVGTTPD